MKEYKCDIISKQGTDTQLAEAIEARLNELSEKSGFQLINVSTTCSTVADSTTWSAIITYKANKQKVKKAKPERVPKPPKEEEAEFVRL